MGWVQLSPPPSPFAGEGPAADAAPDTLSLEQQLLEACREGRAEEARRLLDAGAEPACADSQGVTPLMLAAESGSAEAVSALLGGCMACRSCLLPA